MFGAGPVGGTVGVIFGGPSPEHDVSILTGLQAARVLLLAGHQVGSVEAIYWTKGERFVAVEPTLEAEAFVDGAPKGARELRFLAQPGGGFFAVKPGVLGGGKERRLELNALINCCHGGPGEDGTLQSALDLAGIPYTGPSAAGAALCMDKLAFGSVAAAAGLPSLPRQLVVAGLEAPAWDGAEPIHHQAALWWLFHRHRGDRRVGRCPALRGAGRPTYPAGRHCRAVPL